ncbi:YopX family protein [Paenibacillus larvae]|uniref:YopX family protein n=1 Tax=Paenibacillus larvae TaxID=1464 RepID=UPI00069A8E00|nr:YopX family protein [Paenibacillus larvae]
MRKLSLFSGIGGIDLAAKWAGIETVAFCEKEPFPQKVLRKHWPNTPIYDDVCTLTREVLERDGIITRNRTIDLISAGYPCQPFSNAGKRKGKEDFSPLLQFTGMYDRNDKEIFEDDIVEIRNHPFDRFIGINGMYTVGYSDRMEICCGSWLLHHALPYVTVVGNMYEHSHLLGGTEDE